MNTKNSEINIFVFFSILKKNIIYLIFFPIVISGILLIILFFLQNNSNNFGKYNLIIYENDFLRNEKIYDYNILLSLSFQDILAYQTSSVTGSDISNIVDKSSLIGFNAKKLLTSLQLIDNRNINFLSNTIKNNTKFLNFVEKTLQNDDKKNRIEKFLLSLQVIKYSNDDEVKNLSSDKNIILSLNLNEDVTEVTNEFLYVFEQFLKHVLFDDFDKFTKYYNLVINNQLQKNEAFQINKELEIKKLNDRIEILEENKNIAKNFKNNKQLDLIREMSISSRTFDISNIDYSDFPLYVFGSDFLEAEIDRNKLVISRLAKGSYSFSDNEMYVSKKYISNLKENFSKIIFNFDNLAFFQYDYSRNITNSKITLPVYFVLIYLFVLIILIFYFVLNYIFLSQKEKY